MACITKQYKEISTGDIANLLGNKEIHLIDVRPVDAYNGWTLLHEARGGHISGARNLPVKWTKYIDWIEIIKHKRILPEKKIIIYGHDRNEIIQVSEHFIRAGFPEIYHYFHFPDEWMINESLPMDRLYRFRNLVPPFWVNQLINDQGPDHYDNDRFVIVHVHYRNRDAYLSGHIPGAIDLDSMAVEAPGIWNRRKPDELKRNLLEHGITADTTVVIYGKNLNPDNKDLFPGSAAGDIGAMRIASILMYAGVKDIRVLNGGFQSWTDEGFDVSFADESKTPLAEFGADIPACPELIIDIDGARELLASPRASLVCVRSWPEYTGEVSGYNYIRQKGRIPGALFSDCGSDAYHMENFRNPDLTCREYHEIREKWEKAGIKPDKRLAFYCGTGWRGSEAWFNAWLMGWPEVAVYDGGWLEWSADPANPVETGIPDND